MRDKLRDPLWATISGLIGLLLAGAATFFGWRALTSKGIAYEVSSNAPLVSSQEAVSGRLQVLFDGKPTDDANLIVLKIYNSGNSSILSSDYEYPIQFNFGQNADILSAEIVNTTPPGIPISITQTINTISLSRVLLNSDDSIELRIVASKSEDPTISCRIAGVKKCSLVVPGKGFSWSAIIIGLLVGIIAGQLVGKFIDVLQRNKKLKGQVESWEQAANFIIEDIKQNKIKREQADIEYDKLMQERNLELEKIVRSVNPVIEDADSK